MNEQTNGWKKEEKKEKEKTTKEEKKERGRKGGREEWREEGKEERERKKKYGSKCERPSWQPQIWVGALALLFLLSEKTQTHFPKPFSVGILGLHEHPKPAWHKHK